MSGPDLNTTQSQDDTTHAASRDGPAAQQPRPPDMDGPSRRLSVTATDSYQSAPFQAQLNYLSHAQSHPHNQGQPNLSQYGHLPFDMRAMAGALPTPTQSGLTSGPYGSPDPAQNFSSSSPYQTSPQAMPYAGQRVPAFPDPTMMARAQQQHYMNAQYGGGGPSPIQRHGGFSMQPGVPFSPVDPYTYSLGHNHFSPIDPRFGPQGAFMMPGMPTEPAQFGRGAVSDNAPVPNYPRGPPRKPKQSGHALWVGNLPPAAMVTDLKDHFSRDATSEIESVFLIAKSNCAFVNYKTEHACVGAMNRFHDSRFHGVRLVCRLRRGNASSSSATPPETSTEPTPTDTPTIHEPDAESAGPTIARSQSNVSTVSANASGTETTLPPSTERVQEKYFIVKSLTAQDLEASVRNGIWATQSHNEETLNRAFDQAENVYLIFSANKSGEYFGYARMASTISGEAVNLSSLPSQEDTVSDSASPQSIPTPATATAPRGRIIDDSARGTIFWEADHSEDDSTSSPATDSASGQNWGKQFKIEWVSTSRLPFYRTRGLRNPWNANREVKIARDGTELEPSVGKRLVQMFHRPAPLPSQTANPNLPPGGIQYR